VSTFNIGSRSPTLGGLKTQYNVVQRPGKAKTTAVAKLSSWRGSVICVEEQDNKIVNRLWRFTQEKILYLHHWDSSNPGVKYRYA